MPELPSSREYGPDLEDLEQRDDIVPTAVAVKLDSPVRTQELPARAGTMRNINVGATVPESLVGLELRRKRCVVKAATGGGGVYLATTSQGASDGTGFIIEAGQSLTIEHCEAVFARSTTGVVVVSLLTEDYAN